MAEMAFNESNSRSFKVAALAKEFSVGPFLPSETVSSLKVRVRDEQGYRAVKLIHGDEQLLDHMKVGDSPNSACTEGF